MFRWLPYAMVRITVFLMAGILTGIYLPDFLPEKIILTLLFIFIVSFIICSFILKKNRGFITGTLGLTAITLLGYELLIQKTDSRHEDHLLHHHETVEFYEARVTNTPERKEKSWRLDLAVTKVKSTKWKEVNAKTLLYISRKSDSLDLNYGDVILVKGSPVELQPPANPYEFDFKRFLTFRNIHHQQFVQPEHVKRLHRITEKGILYYSARARQGASDLMRKYLHGQREQAIALALVLGVSEGLDNELQNAYSASGAMHVLSVSGLHVSILYMVILLFLKPFQKYAWGTWVTAGVSLMTLWMYAFITGLSPSVLRAVAMFSFMALAKPFNRGTNIYNTLAASAFVLMLYNPYLIMSVGFQLSYIAVIGIVYLQKPISELWLPENRIINWAWEITCVSIAAQVATFALGLLYFHQFPVYFLFSNLFVIPGSFVVLLLGILLLVVNFIGPVAHVVGYLLDLSIKILNGSVFLVEDLPYSLLNGVYLTTFQCWILIAMIITVILLFKTKSISFLITTLILCICFSASAWSHFFHDVNAGYLVVYKVPGHGTLELIHEGQSVLLSDTTLLNDKEKTRFHITPNRLVCGVATTQNKIATAYDHGGIFYTVWRNKKILWIKNRKAVIPENLVTDYLIVGNNSLSVSHVNRIRFKTLILDSSNSTKYVDLLRKKMCDSEPSFHSVSEKAFLEKF